MMEWNNYGRRGILPSMPRSLLYIALTLVIVAAGVADWSYGSSAPWLEPPHPADEPRLASCEEAIVAARHSPYWRNQSVLDRLAVECRPAPGGWRLTASGATQGELCELYVGRDRLIAPRLPCQGVGVLEHD